MMAVPRAGFERLQRQRRKPPSSCPSPRGEKGPLNQPQREFKRPLSPWGERQSEGAFRNAIGGAWHDVSAS